MQTCLVDQDKTRVEPLRQVALNKFMDGFTDSATVILSTTAETYVKELDDWCDEQESCETVANIEQFIRKCMNILQKCGPFTLESVMDKNIVEIQRALFAILLQATDTQNIGKEKTVLYLDFLLTLYKYKIPCKRYVLL